MMKTARLAFANVEALRKRLVGLVILIAVAVGLCVTSFALTERAQAVSLSRLQEGVANRSIQLWTVGDGDKLLTARSLKAVASLPGVADVEPVAQTSFDFETKTVPGVLLHATTPRAAFLPPVVAQTRSQVFPLRAGEAVLPARSQGSDLRPLLGRTITVEITRGIRPGEGEGVDRRVKVVGLFDPSWQLDNPDAAYLDPRTVVSWAALRAGVSPGRFLSTYGYSSATVLATGSDQVPSLLQVLQGQGFAASSYQQELTALPAVLELVRVVGYALVVFLLILTAFSSYQVMSALARQRNREVGILKAVGFTDARVFGLISVEALVVALVAAVGGLVLSVGLATLGNALLRRLPDLRSYLSAGVVLPHPSVIAAAILAVVAVIGLGALLPAWRAARLTPAEAIREW